MILSRNGKSTYLSKNFQGSDLSSDTGIMHWTVSYIAFRLVCLMEMDSLRKMVCLLHHDRYVGNQDAKYICIANVPTRSAGDALILSVDSVAAIDRSGKKK